MKFMKNANGQILLFFAALGLVVNLSGCTSGDEKSDVDAVQDVENLGSTDGATPSDDSLLSDALPEEALGNEAAKPKTAADDASLNPSNEPPLDISDSADGTAQPPMTLDEPASNVGDMPPASPAPVDQGTSMVSSTEQGTVSDDAPKKPSASLQKMATKPWKVGKTWFNAVYFARPGDNLSAISQNIYGEDRTKMLKKGNPTYASRDTKPGDKVYYNSPKRPDDGEQMLTWFEENGVQPEVYVAKEGDNIRSVSKGLLGYDNAWKEVWASNLAVESKGKLPAGSEIRYWKSTAVAAAAPGDAAPPPPAGNGQMNAEANSHQAANEELPPPPPMDQPADMAASPPPPPPPADQAMNDLPPPPPFPDSNGQAAANDIPPPPPMDAAPPPPPVAAPVAHAKDKSETEATAMDEDTMIALGTVAVAAAGIAALLVVRRRRKQKELEAFSDHTQVGT